MITSQSFSASTASGLLVYFTFLGLTLACSSRETITETYANGAKKFTYEQTDLNGKKVKDGSYSAWFENGQLKTVGNYVFDKQQGIWKLYYSSGKLANVGKYEMGRQDSVWIYFDDKEKTIKQLTYKLGKLDGIQKVFYPNGQEKLVQHYRAGIPVSDLTFWDDQHNLVGVCHFKDGANTTLLGDWVMEIDESMIHFVWTLADENRLKRRYEIDTPGSESMGYYSLSSLETDSLPSKLTFITEGNSPDNIDGDQPNVYTIKAISDTKIELQRGTTTIRLTRLSSPDSQLATTSSLSNKSSTNYHITPEATDQFTDPRNNMAYPTAKIGGVWWLMKNVNYTLPGSLCYDQNTDNCARHGRIYKWNQALRACPSGWRLPTRNELIGLLHPYGKISYSGDDKTLETVFGEYEPEKTDVTFKNLAKDNALNLPVFKHNPDYDTGQRTMFWSSETSTPDRAYSIYWDVNGNDGKGGVFFSDYPVEFYGFCRCVKK